MTTEGNNTGPLDLPDAKAKATVRAIIESEQPTLQPQTQEQLRAKITSDECQTIQPGSLDRLKVTDDSTSTVPPKPPTEMGISRRGSEPLPEQEPGFPIVPGYHIVKELGKGGMGVVYLARQIKLHRQVALKMIRGGFVERSEQRERFLIEAEAVAKLQHPNIVQIFEVGDVPQTDGSVIPYMALEFVGGPSLEGHLNGKPMTSQSAAELVSQLAFAMHFAHEQHLIHRDLKPANILLAPAEDRLSKILNQSETRKRMLAASSLPFIPKITDFGLAKQIDADSSQTKAGEIMGTPSYMAPEQAAASKDIGPAADTYALGVSCMSCSRVAHRSVLPRRLIRSYRSSKKSLCRPVVFSRIPRRI
ncbi:MAG: serine/threonine-protein kinase [Gemmatales bacterium]